MISIVWRTIFLFFVADTSVCAIQWTKCEVLNILDASDDTPLDSNRDNGLHFNSDDNSKLFTYFFGAMEELDRRTILENAMIIEGLKKYIVKYDDGRTEELNLVQYSGGGATGNNLYLKKLGDDEFCIYTISSGIRWTKVEVSSILSHPSNDDKPLDGNRENGLHFEGDYDPYFLGAMEELGRPVITENAIFIDHLKKYTVKYGDGHSEQLNLVYFHGCSDSGNSFYLQKVEEDEFRIYIVAGDWVKTSSISERLTSIRWTKREAAFIVRDPFDDTPLDCNRKNGLDFDGYLETCVYFSAAMKKLGRPMVPENAFTIGGLKKHIVKYNDGRLEQLNLVQCTSGAGKTRNILYLQKFGDDELRIYTIPSVSDDESSGSQNANGIRWSKVEVSSIRSDPSDGKPLPFTRRNGRYFVGNHATHFTGAMNELGRPIILDHAFMIGRLKKHTVKHTNGLTEELNLVRFRGGSAPGNRFYLRKVDENNYCIYTIVDDSDDLSTARELSNIHWTKKEVLDVIHDPSNDRPLPFTQQNGRYFMGNYDTHFIEAMNEIGRLIILEHTFRINRLKKYTVEYKDGRTEELNLVLFEGGCKPGNRFYLREVDENNYCIYTVIGDDDLSAAERLSNIRWTKKEVLDVIHDPHDNAPLPFTQQNGDYFVGTFDVHFTGAMRELGRPIMPENSITIGPLRKYTVKYSDDLTKELNLRRFDGGSEPGNRFHLQEVDENNYCIYTVIGDDGPTFRSTGGSPEHYEDTQ